MTDLSAKVTSLLFVLQNDFGVIVYRNKNKEITVGTIPEYVSKKPLDNPRVKELLAELYSYPRQIILGYLPKATSTDTTITDNSNRRATQLHDKPQNEEINAGVKLLQEEKFPEAAQKFLNAFISDPRNSTAISNCAACFWLGVKKYFAILSPMVFGGCRSGAPDELMLTYLLNPVKFPGTLFARQLREAVPVSDLTRVSKCLKVAEHCFKVGLDLGNKTALHWMVTLTRGTGRYEECRKLVHEASAKLHLSPDEIDEVRKRVDGIKDWELDLTDIDHKAGGWVIPDKAFLIPSILDRLLPIAEEVDTRISSLEEKPDSVAPKKRGWRFWR